MLLGLIRATLNASGSLRRNEVAVLYFFRRGGESMSCETRLDPSGPGYQLVVTENHASRIEHFNELPQLLAREHELLMAWRAQGWRDVGQPTRTSVDTWTGPR
jgi:hypothetical protein